MNALSKMFFILLFIAGFYSFFAISYTDFNDNVICTRIQLSEERYNCSHSGLHNIPTFPNSSTSIDLSNNKITTIQKDSFSGLGVLLYLRLDMNIISEIQEGSFLPLTSLRYLSLGYNRISVTALENLRDLPRLYYLDIVGNEYISYPSSFARMRNLNTLKIDVFKDFKFNDNFSSLRNLSKVHLNPRPKFSILNDSFQGFRNSPITELKLMFHKMVYAPIGDGFLQPFRFLKRLKVDISFNFDIKKALKVLYGVRNMTLDVLDLSGNNWDIMRHVRLTTKDIQHLLTMCITELNLFNNRIDYFPFSKSFGSPFYACLEKLIMPSNTIVWTFIEAFSLMYFPKLRYLDVSAISYQPYESSYFGLHDRYLDVSALSCREPDQFSVGMPDIYGADDILQRVIVTMKGPFPLEYLDISGSDLRKTVILPLLYKLDFPYLKTIKSSRTSFSLCNYNVMFEASLIIFDMSGWQCRQIKPKFIQRHINLTYLNMAYSDIGHFINSNDDPIIRGLTKLESIDISGNSIEKFVDYFFQDQKHSLRILNLRENNLRVIPSAFEPLRQLQQVDLSNNYFTYFDKKERQLLDMFENTTFDFQGNRFSCSCMHLDSLVWLQRKSNFKNLFCDDGTKIIDIFQNIRTFQINCLSKFWLDFTIVLLLLMIISIVLVALGYKNKAVVVYLYLKAKRIVKQRQRQMDRDSYKYDVFVSYSHLDFDWVTGPLFRYLKEELSLQVCMHQKDFIPGEPIAEEILRCIDSSRKSVFVITRNFLESKWSMFEMELARQHVFMNDTDTILIILKDDLHVHELPKLLKKIWWRTVCLAFPKKDIPEEMERFWNGLSKVFQGD